MPARNMWHLAHETVNSSIWTIAYSDPASERNRDPACMMSQASACCCWRMKPNPWRLVSVHRHVGLVGSKYTRVGGKHAQNRPIVPGAEEWA